MNIQQAKIEIGRTLRIYLQKDEKGRYVYPALRQRPLLLMGPPGIGKTAIMEQLSREENVALVSYTMTHHTRQSAIGLPKIAERTFQGEKLTVTEYTLSEILASVYESMDRTGLSEGILFLDEINCVSETLAPTMLQFLQNKTFGNRALPEGWLIVAAGNPPEYNKSVRDYDIVTLDRLRVLNVEADTAVFLSYAADASVHGAVISYLMSHPENFYYAERNDDSLRYVTARGWEDLSDMLRSAEQLGYEISKELIAEFLNREETVRDFYAYYRLYSKYGTDYAVEGLLNGTVTGDDRVKKLALAKNGDFTERFMVVNLITEYILRLVRSYREQDRFVTALHDALKLVLTFKTPLQKEVEDRRRAEDTKKKYSLVSFRNLRRLQRVTDRMEEMDIIIRGEHIHTRDETEARMKALFDLDKVEREQQIQTLQAVLGRAFAFITEAFGPGQEMTVFVSRIAASADAMDYIARHGCEPFLQEGSRLLARTGESDLREACAAALRKG